MQNTTTQLCMSQESLEKEFGQADKKNRIPQQSLWQSVKLHFLCLAYNKIPANPSSISDKLIPEPRFVLYKTQTKNF